MSNVPSSAVLAIIAIVAAVVVASFVFVVATQQTQHAQHTEARIEAQQQENYDSYIGERLDGESVKSFIKVHVNDDIYALVINNDGTTKYFNYTQNLEKIDSSLQKQDVINTYVHGSSIYDCSVNKNEDTGAVVGLTFTEE